MNTAEWTPERLFETSGGYWTACVLHAAVTLDVCTALGERKAGVRDVAADIKAAERGTELLLNALAAMQLISKTGEEYCNTPFSASFLSKDSPQYAGYMIRHHSHLMSSWDRLAEAVKSGEPVRNRESRDDEELREGFLMGMFNLASGVAPRVAEEIDLSNRSHLLDMGGGPGTYAIHFCLKNPQLKASVYDLPTTRPFAEKIIARFDLSDRIRFIPGDYLKDDIEGSYDAVWLSHVLHSEDPSSCERMLRKAVSVLEPGGTILVHDFILNNAMDGPVFPALFALNMLVNTPRGRSYSEEQIIDMLSRVGASDLQRTSFHGPNDSGIILGTRPR
ncbi:methyltransferase [Planctomycetota bacterium]